MSIGFLAEGEEEDLSQLTTEAFFRENHVLITTEEERQEEWYQKAKNEMTPENIPTPVVMPTSTVTPLLTPSPEATPTAMTWSPEPPQALAPITTAESEKPPVYMNAGMPEEASEPADISESEEASEPADISESEETAESVPTETPEPEVTAEPVPTETPEPAEDLYIYASTTLTEDVVCGNLVIIAGTLDCNGYTVTVQKDMSIVGGGCTLQGGTLDVAGDSKLQNGSLNIGAGNAVIGGSLQEGEKGKIQMLHSQSKLQVKLRITSFMRCPESRERKGANTGKKRRAFRGYRCAG